jgi:hypothetical protein
MGGTTCYHKCHVIDRVVLRYYLLDGSAARSSDAGSSRAGLMPLTFSGRLKTQVAHVRCVRHAIGSRDTLLSNAIGRLGAETTQPHHVAH